MADILKALQVGDVDVLIPKEIDKVVQHLVNYDNPIRQNMPRRPGSGKAWDLVQRTPAADSKIAFYNPDTKTFTTGGKGVYAEASFTYRTVGVNGEIMRTAMIATKDQLNLKSEEIERRIIEFKNYEEWAMVWGDNTPSPENYEYDGIDKQITTARTLRMASDQVGAALTLAKMDELIDKCAPYKPGMLIMSLAARRQLNSALQPQQRFDTMEVKGGFKVPTYLEIPIFTSTNVGDTLGLTNTGYGPLRLVATYISGTQFSLVGDQSADYAVGQTINADCGADGIIAAEISVVSFGGGITTVTVTVSVLTANILTTQLTGITTTVYALNLDHFWVGERQKLMYEETKLSSQYTSFDIFEDVTVVMSNGLPHAKLTGVKIS